MKAYIWFIKFFPDEKNPKKFKLSRNTNFLIVILTNQTFKVRVTLHKMKRVNAPLRLTKVVIVCLLKVINAGPAFKTKTAYTVTNKTIKLSIKTG